MTNSLLTGKQVKFIFCQLKAEKILKLLVKAEACLVHLGLAKLKHKPGFLTVRFSFPHAHLSISNLVFSSD